MVLQAPRRSLRLHGGEENGVSENGIDLGAIYGAIIAISNELKAFKAEMSTFKAEVRAEFRTVHSEVADLRHSVGELRTTLHDYHGAVLSHGVLLTELDERVTRLEQRGQPA